MIIPLVGTFIVGVVMYYVLGIPVAWLNQTLLNMLSGLGAGSLVFLGIIQGAMLAFDMGGPVNKAAYAFALAALEAGNAAPMSANFVASMVPPMGLAIAMLIAKNKFTELERKGIGGCFVGGLCMITEFAIPYAAADPIRVIPALMLGGAFGASLSYVFGLTLMAPHGGLFVIPLANSPLLWLLVFVLASFFTALMLILFKRKVPVEVEEE